MKYKKKEKYRDKSVYMFHNIVTDVTLYVNADSASNACKIFDSCGFQPRSCWKILLEIAQQPSDGKKGK